MASKARPKNMTEARADLPKKKHGQEGVPAPLFHRGEYDGVKAAQAVAAFEPIMQEQSFASVFDESWLSNEFRGNRTGNFRSAEPGTGRAQNVLWQCNQVYESVDIVHNIFDMMSSFGAQGIKVVHPVKSKQKIYQEWATRVKMKDVSQQFLSILYVMANVFIKRDVKELTKQNIKDMSRTFASLRGKLGNDGVYEPLVRPNKNQIPTKYKFLNPASIETIHGELSTFLGNPIYILRLPRTLITNIKTPDGPTQEEMVNSLPPYVRDPVNKGEVYIRLDNDQIQVFHHMKKDWQQFAPPILYPLLPQIEQYRKLQEADIAALNGVISQVRLWTLGDYSVNPPIQPEPAAFQALRETLQHVGKGGSMDIAWDATLKFQESSTSGHNFLGIKKYEPVYRAIYAGLGMPQSLTGGEESGAGFTNNAISIKILIERLQYGRDKLREFWMNELRILQEALGDKTPASIIFDDMDLFEDANERNVWISLLEHGVISPETLQEKFGLIPEVEERRLKRNMTRVASGKSPEAKGPFELNTKSHDLAKTALGQGTVAPTEVGLQKDPKQPGDKSLLDHNLKMEKERQKDPTGLPGGSTKKPAGKPGKGRPPGKKDSVQRKKKKVSVRNKAKLSKWATEAYDQINNFVASSFLRRCSILSVDELSESDLLSLANIKVSTMMNLEPFAEVTEEHVEEIIASFSDDTQPFLPVYAFAEFVANEAVIGKYVQLNTEQA